MRKDHFSLALCLVALHWDTHLALATSNEGRMKTHLLSLGAFVVCHHRSGASDVLVRLHLPLRADALLNQRKSELESRQSRASEL